MYGKKNHTDDISEYGVISWLLICETYCIL